MKRLIVCCDGTWDDADNKSLDTNVFRMAQAIHGFQHTGGVFQIVLYLRGVGTTGLKADTLIEGMTGFGVDDNIRSAYQFIAQNYIPGDEIFIFGFSRGAFEARSLSGLLSACGILKRQKVSDIPSAWEYYRSPKPHDPKTFMARYNTDCHVDAKIKFLGVWDTVGALGIPLDLFKKENEEKFAFHDTGPSQIIQHGCHALAVDEHRHDFTPTFWTQPLPAGVNIEQVWFAGAHSDVGGGYKTRRLADIPLVWMAQKAEADGLALDWSCLPEKSKLDPLAPTHDSSSGLFFVDRFRPTYRRVLQTDCHVSFYERLYRPLDDEGKPLATINEAIHCSVEKRFDQTAQTCSDDDNGTCTKELYTPKNLTPFFEGGKLKAGVKVAD